MSKYEYAKRLKRMLNNECEITQMETNIARKSAKYYEKLTSLKTMLNKQDHELINFRHEVDKIKHYNEKLEEFIQSEEDRLRGIIQNVERLREEHKQAEQQRIEQRKLELTRKEFIRSIKETTQMFFNINALPHKFQGVSVHETETSSEWKPFDIDAQSWMRFLEEQWRQRQQNQMEVESESGKAESEQHFQKVN